MPTLHHRSRAFGIAILAFALASLTLATVAYAAPARDSVRGRITKLVSSIGTAANVNYDFSADSSAVGTDVSGTYKETRQNSDPNVVITGDVTCLRVGGGTGTSPAMASIGGVVTKGGEFVFTVDPFTGTFGPARGFIIQTSDDGKFSTTADTFQVTYTFAPVPPDACPAPTLGNQLVAEGDVIIHNALP